jgi:hypothetical protein
VKRLIIVVPPGSRVAEYEEFGDPRTRIGLLEPRGFERGEAPSAKDERLSGNLSMGKTEVRKHANHCKIAPEK